MCRHRGAAIVLDEFGQSDKLVCGYHGWTYDHDGNLIGKRDPKDFVDFDDSCRSLHKVKVELLGNLKRLGELVIKQLNDVLDSYVNKNYDKAKEVWEKDEQVDDLTYIAMESVIDFLSKDKKNLDFSTHLIFATKNLERAGDHITNIAETVCYLVKGEYLKGSRPKGKVIQE